MPSFSTDTAVLPNTADASTVLPNPMLSAAYERWERHSRAMTQLPLDDHGILLSRELARYHGDGHALSRGTGRGEYARLRRGAYIPWHTWQSSSALDRHVLAARAVHLLAKKPPVFSHYTAAALWGLPILGEWPQQVHCLADRASGGRSAHGIVRHAVDRALADIRVVDGLAVTSIERTVLDLAATSPFASAIVTADFALSITGRCESRSTTREGLAEHLDALQLGRGRRRIERVLAFADGASESPGESLSRARIWELGFPAPTLQVEIPSGRWRNDRVDFFWEAYGLVGEFDGEAKYRDREMRNGRTAEQVVIDEKRREDRIRSRGFRFARWDWRDAMTARPFAAILEAAGLPRGPHQTC